MLGRWVVKMGDAWRCLRTEYNERLGMDGAEPSGSATSFLYR
jgi:hypothetical protein